MSDKVPDRPTVAQRLLDVVGEDGVSLSEPLSEHTTFEIGGPADVFVAPDSIESAERAIAICREEGVPFFVLGRGSDLLVSDLGYRGVIICMADALDDLVVEDEKLVCQSGVTLSDAAEMACALGLTGLEFACGIPGTVDDADGHHDGRAGGHVASGHLHAKLAQGLGILLDRGPVAESGEVGDNSRADGDGNNGDNGNERDHSGGNAVPRPRLGGTGSRRPGDLLGCAVNARAALGAEHGTVLDFFSAVGAEHHFS